MARVELGLTVDEFNDLVPAQWQALCKALSNRKREGYMHTASVVAAIYNSTGRLKTPLTVEELMGERPKREAQGDDREDLRNYLETMKGMAVAKRGR